MPVTQKEFDILLEKANGLPLCPGVYIMKNKAGKVIYVGKSKKLKNRVSQYFHGGVKNIKTAKMVNAVHDFDYYVCDTEIEALTLENTLIKQYTPRYNIRLKDAKSYPYIKITQEEYPRLVCTRTRSSDKAKYFGPYSGTAAVYLVISMLEKALGLPSCKRQFPRDIGKERPCLYYQMGKCCGVCTGKISKEEYSDLIKCAYDVLRGHTSAAKQRLQQQMMECAEAELFEAAAKIRDTITALDNLRQRQKVVASPETEQDVIGFYSDDTSSCITVFYIREGVLSDRGEFVFGNDEIADIGALTSFLCEHYINREYIPQKILLSFHPEDGDLDLLTQFLSDRAGRKITIKTPERGDLKTLCDMAVQNAYEKCRVRSEEIQKSDGTLLNLARTLCLEAVPERIESYDISNMGSDNITAGMIVCVNGRFKKSDYRSFNIKGISSPDDYASMCEAITRRFSHLNDEKSNDSFTELPDLILLDGGRGHVSVVRETLSQLGISIPVFGMVKDDYHKTRAICTDTEEISIAHDNELFTFIYKIQEEVHRFTISKMTHAKRSTVKHSSLEKIKGIGPEKAKKLLAAFKGLQGIKAATYEELLTVKGITSANAKDIFNHFHNSTEENNI